jgi:hypothetical protein
MGQGSSSSLLEDSLRESIESLIDSAPDAAPAEDASNATESKDASKGDGKSGEPAVDDKAPTEKKFSNKLLFNDDYTELKITNGKQFLKWKTVTLSQNGVSFICDFLKYQGTAYSFTILH